MPAEEGPIEFTLAGKKHQPPKLKLGQLRGLLDALSDMGGKAAGASIDAAVAVIVAGFPGHADMTVEKLLDSDASLEEMNLAVAAVIEMAGLKPTGEAGPAAETV